MLFVDSNPSTHELEQYHTVTGRMHFWALVRSRAAELLGRAAVPGDDYSITEVVYCKSADEIDVGAAAAFCADRYLTRLVGLAPLEFFLPHAVPAIWSLTVWGEVVWPTRSPMMLRGPHRNAGAEVYCEECREPFPCPTGRAIYGVVVVPRRSIVKPALPPCKSGSMFHPAHPALAHLEVTTSLGTLEEVTDRVVDGHALIQVRLTQAGLRLCRPGCCIRR
jgi:hypothetical protein